MATNKLMSDLFRAISSDDHSRARDIASAIAAETERKGHRSAARKLRSSLRASPIPHQTNGAIFPSAALVLLSADTSFEDVVLSGKARQTLNELVLEWRHRDYLRKRGIPPRTKLLFFGPPGCGKSMTARALGRALSLPVYVVRFDAVIGAYLGQTAIHLRQLFKFAEEQPCILLLDEMDALGKQRGNPLDVGELDRIVIALMQELEHSHPRGLVIGTSNLPRHLDMALWRRFDLTLEFPKPTQSQIRSYALRKARELRFSIEGLPRKLGRSQSFAEAERLLVAEARMKALRSLK
jgi:SpoVK/Ycf46/Vps4 family AAA+-type ATPase